MLANCGHQLIVDVGDEHLGFFFDAFLGVAKYVVQSLASRLEWTAGLCIFVLRHGTTCELENSLSTEIMRWMVATVNWQGRHWGFGQ